MAVAGLVALSVAAILAFGGFDDARQRQIVFIGAMVILAVVVAGGVQAHTVARRLT